MDIESEQGKGTSFCISLPAALGAEPVHEQAEPAREHASTLRILLVDDQPIILDVLQQQLAEDGHEIVTAGSGQEALALLQERACDLVMTDQSMPGMTGDELAALIKEKNPKTGVILLTGFGGSDSDNDDRPPGVDMIVGKPATSVDLRRAIVRVMQ